MALFDSQRTALVLIDLQGANLDQPHFPVSSVDVVSRSAELVDRARAAGSLVVHVRTSFLPDESDSLQPLRIEKMRPIRPHRREGWDTIVETVAPVPNEPVIVKRSWNAFHGSDLDLQLRRHGCDTIVIAGMSTHFGVEGTARAAYEHYYNIVFAEGAMSSNSEDNHDFAVREIFPQLGVVRPLEDVLNAFGPEGRL